MELLAPSCDLPGYEQYNPSPLSNPSPQFSYAVLTPALSPISLVLRFWVNIMKNPQFLFDMEKPAVMESFLNTLSQCLIDSFSRSDFHLTEVCRLTNISHPQ